MRSFEERKAEILRRSENKIQKRKRTQKVIFTCCIPICLCIAILSAIYLPDMIYTDIEDGFSENTLGTVITDDDVYFAYTKVTIKLPSGEEVKEKDATKVESIYDIIQSSFVPKIKPGQENKNHSESTGSSKNSFLSDDEDTVKASNYTIVFSETDGTQLTYTLDGNKLIDEASGERVFLTDEELSALKKAIVTEEETE